jgi:hypothetical protein
MKKIVKLKLNKETIVSLNEVEQKSIQGGLVQGCGTYIDPISCCTVSAHGYVSDCPNCYTTTNHPSCG